MPKRKSKRIQCPTCKNTVKPGSADVPFCSERCRAIDLGKWASGAYVISSPLLDQSDGLRDAEDTED